MLEELRKVWFALSIAMLAGIARSVTDKEKRKVWPFVQGLFLAGFVGAMTAFALEQTNFSEPFKGFIIGLASFAGEDLLMGVLKLSKQFGLQPLESVRRWIALLLRR